MPDELASVFLGHAVALEHVVRGAAERVEDLAPVGDAELVERLAETLAWRPSLAAEGIGCQVREHHIAALPSVFEVMQETEFDELWMQRDQPF